MQYKPEGASHLPILIKVLNLSNGPALEIGMGPFSTPIMHWLCLDKKRKLESYENNPNWFGKNKIFETDLHKIYFVGDWDEIDIEDKHWGVAFIDHAPADRRKVEIKRLANNTDFVVVHDSDEIYEADYGYEEIYSLFKYRYNYKRESPYTTVLSNFVDLSILSK